MSMVLNHLKPEKEELKPHHLDNLIFGDYLFSEEEAKISDTAQVQKVMEGYLQEYNMVSKSSMSLVMFPYIMQHISRVSRVLKQEYGHLLLIGLSGSGRHSITKLASFMANYDVFQKNNDVTEDGLKYCWYGLPFIVFLSTSDLIGNVVTNKMDASPLSLYNFYTERVKKNLHIVVVMSPLGDTFRRRLRMFPSLVNCCTIDWLVIFY
ncbi:hypothetical protein Avbf_01109 [Armadillidium vulgare]|nr:hypothetical protein Avbf_01109 [Armadillidium vulgare]